MNRGLGGFLNPPLVPSLDELAADRSKAAELPPESLRVLYVRANELAGFLLASLLTSKESPGTPKAAERLLAVEEAARRLAVTVDWLYRHARALPFTVKNGGRQVRFSERGIERYIRERQGLNE